MNFDSSFKNIPKVDQLIKNCPSRIEFAGFSEAVQDILFDAYDYLDAMVGYSSWYLRKKSPKVYEGAFLPKKFWEDLEMIEANNKNPFDIPGIRKTREIGEFVQRLTNLMFAPSK